MARKVYVSINADFDASGKLRPRSLTWIDGTVFEISKIVACVRAASTKVGGCGDRYTVIINSKESFLFREKDRWFVEAKQ